MPARPTPEEERSSRMDKIQLIIDGSASERSSRKPPSGRNRKVKKEERQSNGPNESGEEKYISIF